MAVLIDAYAGLDPALKADTVCWVMATEGDDDFLYIAADPVCDPSAVPEAGAVAALGDAYPNPFNPRTTLSFDLPVAGPVRLLVHDVSGRVVDVLLDDQVVRPGLHRVDWRGRDRSGRELPSGAYFYRLESGAYRATKKMLLLR
jgi:hypothetical protein